MYILTDKQHIAAYHVVYKMMTPFLQTIRIKSTFTVNPRRQN